MFGRTHRTLVEDRPARGITRVFPNTYEVDAHGWPIANEPTARVERGVFVRAAQPVFMLAPPVEPYDPTDPAGWVSQRG